MPKEIKIAIIGLRYLGLPLARLFPTKYAMVGFDNNKARVSQLIIAENLGYITSMDNQLKEELLEISKMLTALIYKIKQRIVK